MPETRNTPQGCQALIGTTGANWKRDERNHTISGIRRFADSDCGIEIWSLAGLLETPEEDINKSLAQGPDEWTGRVELARGGKPFYVTAAGFRALAAERIQELANRGSGGDEAKLSRVAHRIALWAALGLSHATRAATSHARPFKND